MPKRRSAIARCEKRSKRRAGRFRESTPKTESSPPMRTTTTQWCKPGASPGCPRGRRTSPRRRGGPARAPSTDWLPPCTRRNRPPRGEPRPTPTAGPPCRWQAQPPPRIQQRQGRPESDRSPPWNSLVPRSGAGAFGHAVFPVGLFVACLGRPVLIGVIHHQPVRSEHLALAEGPFDDHSDAFAKHLRRYLGRAHQHRRGIGLLVVRDAELKSGVLSFPLNAASLDDAPEPNGGTVSEVPLGEHLGRAPVENQILTQISEGDERQSAPGDR